MNQDPDQKYYFLKRREKAWKEMTELLHVLQSIFVDERSQLESPLIHVGTNERERIRTCDEFNKYFFNMLHHCNDMKKWLEAESDGLAHQEYMNQDDLDRIEMLKNQLRTTKKDS